MTYAALVAADAPWLYWRLGEAAAPAGSPYARAVRADAPLAYWPLDETSGTVAHDASGNGYDGTYPLDGSVTAGAATTPAGTPCAQYNDTSVADPTTLHAGQGTGITIDSPGALPTAPAAGTIEYWINAALPASYAEGSGVDHGFYGPYMMPLWWGTTDGSEPYVACDVQLMNVGKPGYGGSLFGGYPDGGLRNAGVYEYNDNVCFPGSGQQGFPDAAWTAGWHHVALTWGAGAGHIYLDGAAWSSTGVDFSAFVAQSGAVTYGAIGAGPPGPGGWWECVTGALAHVALYDHALTAERVGAHYGASMAGAGTTVLADSSGGGRTGTPSAGVTLAQPGLVRADGNTAALCNGSDGRAVQDATSTLPAAASIECWMQTTTTQGGVLAQFATADATLADLTLYLRTDGVPAFRAGDTEIVRSSDRTVADGRIHHLVATLDADAAAWLYVDGNQAAHAEGVTPASPFTGRWQIGAGTTLDLAVPPLSAAYAGTIDEVAIYVD